MKFAGYIKSKIAFVTPEYPVLNLIYFLLFAKKSYKRKTADDKKVSSQ